MSHYWRYSGRTPNFFKWEYWDEEDEVVVMSVFKNHKFDTSLPDMVPGDPQNTYTTQWDMMIHDHEQKLQVLPEVRNIAEAKAMAVTIWRMS